MIRSFVTTEKNQPGIPMDLICLDDPRKLRSLYLPSWVTDWSVIWRCHIRGSNFSSITRRELDKYCACGDQPAKVKFIDNGRTMVTSGYIFDTIQSLSNTSKYS